MHTTWRARFRPIIAAVIAHVGTGDPKALRKALREAFPAGPREYHPYKIWLDEIKVQLGQRKLRKSSAIPRLVDSRQGGMFDE